MITRILESRSSVGPVLAYNDRKVWEGNAEMVTVRNAHGETLYAASRAMDALVSNPAVSVRARKIAFHMTVGPGADDPPMTDDDIVRYVDDVMAGLGYGLQPYVIYRHEDIDRAHYHVVSVNVLPDGRMVDRRNDRRRLLSLQQRLAPKYGFRVGLAEAAESPAVKPARMRAGMKDVLSTMRADFMDAASWRLSPPLEASLSAALGAWGIETRRLAGKDGAPYVSFRGTDAAGKPVGRFVSSRRVLGMDMLGFLDGRIEAQRPDPDNEEAARIAGAVRDALSRSASLEEFSAALRRLHLHLHLVSEGEAQTRGKDPIPRRAARTGGIAGLVVADRVSRRTYSDRELGVDMSRVRSLPQKSPRIKAARTRNAVRGIKI